MDAVSRPSPTRVQILDDDGCVREDASVPDVDDEEMLAIYRDMCLARRVDRRAVSLTRQGRVSSFPPLYGHEAAQVASARAVGDDDWIVPSYRDHGALIAHGLDPSRVLQYFMGDERGNAVPEDVDAFPINGSVGTQIPHAVGLAWASKLTGADEAFVCYFGDGATSEGDFHEAMNFAGVFDTPSVFLCQNNQWAISVPRERQTASRTLAGKAAAYGFEGVQVDGMDPLAVYRVTRTAAAKARDPGDDERRPTLVEAVLYRLGAHSTADDPSRYRDEVPEEWQAKDPVPRFETFLRETGRLDDERADAIQDRVEERAAEAVESAESAERPDPDAIFEDTFAAVPADLEDQAASLERLRETYGDDVLREDD